MRTFLAISFFVALASARPDVSLGYNYNHPSDSGNYHGSAPSYGSHLGASSGLHGAHSGLGGFGGQGGHLGGHGGIGGHGGGLGGGHGGGLGGHGGGIGGFGGQQQYTEEPLVSKQFYIHSAPEDTSGSGQTKHFTLGRSQKNYRVVFIKAPSSGDANAKLSAEYAPSEEKTHIYVLSQKEHELDANDIATPAPTQPSKPEVFFIKYKTPEEAVHAQTQIQAQYDALGGTSEVSDEGVAPLSSVEGSLGGSAGGQGLGGQGLGGHGIGGHGIGGHGIGGHGIGGHGHGLGGHGIGGGLIGAGSSPAGSAVSGNYLPPNF